jgi:predicted amidohydrolase YtcJ
VGRRADITVLSGDPFRDDPRTLLRGQVVMTISRGRITYRR